MSLILSGRKNSNFSWVHFVVLTSRGSAFAFETVGKVTSCFIRVADFEEDLSKSSSLIFLSVVPLSVSSSESMQNFFGFEDFDFFKDSPSLSDSESAITLFLFLGFFTTGSSSLSD